MSNIRLLPAWIPDEECKALIAWVDGLEIGELKKLKNLAEQNKLLLEAIKEYNWIVGQLESCVERAENIIDGPIQDEAMKHRRAFEKRQHNLLKSLDTPVKTAAKDTE